MSRNAIGTLCRGAGCHTCHLAPHHYGLNTSAFNVDDAGHRIGRFKGRGDGGRKTRSLVGGDNDNDAAVLDNDGNDDAGPGRGFIACCDLTAYAGAKSACWWQDDGDHTRRRTAAMRLLDRMGGLTTTPSLLLREIKDHDGGLSSSLSLSFNSL